jgi:hypothetical protein
MLARKISLAKWKNPEWGAEVPADAVTGDLRTSDNTLSFWSIESSSREELELVVLALGSAADRIDKVDLTWVDRDKLASQGISLVPSDGNTPVESLKRRHVDLARLDLGRLGRVATLVSDSVLADQHRRWSQNEVLRLLVTAVKSGSLDPAKLAAPVKQEVLAGLAFA